MRFDAIVIGFDPAACQAALEGAQHGLSVMMICPQKRFASKWTDSLGMHLLREAIIQEQTATRILGDGKTALGRFMRLSLDHLRQRVDEVGALQRNRLRQRTAASGVTVVDADVVLESSSRVRVSGGEEHDAPTIIIATGSRPRRPTRFEFDDHVFCDFESIFRRTPLPRRLLVIGADGVGCEVAGIFAAIGTTVTAVDRRERLLRFVDGDLLELFHERMRRVGVDIVLKEQIARHELRLDAAEPHAIVEFESGRVEVADCVAVCAGVVPATEELGLAELGVETDSLGFISVDDFFQTSVPGVYAAGGVVANPTRSPGAWHGRVAMRHALGLGSEIGLEVPTPISLHGIPEIAMIGVTEAMCRCLDVECVVGTASFRDTLWGQIRADPEGLLKLVVERGSRRLLGVHAIGAGASDLIQLGASTLARGGTIDELADAPFDPTTPAETYTIAAQAALRQLGDGKPSEERSFETRF